MITYRNPVWSGYFADPFVLKHGNEYFAYGTSPDGPQADGRIFPVLHSHDLAQWELIGGALVRPADPERAYYWAPEVAERDGKFYLYYSAAPGTDDEQHRLRVAVADHPAGPFREVNSLLLPDEGFTIDAHPFQNPKDGNWYLLFSKDFFDELPGTALAGVLLADDMISVAGPVTTLLRASDKWQIFARQRLIYGRFWDAWYTLEGPTVRVHEGRYYMLYSGGNWQGGTYGVGCAVADSVLGPYSEPESGPVVLSGDRDEVTGPGHCSVVMGPDNQTEFVVYHAWDENMTGRRMHIDPLVWTANGPRCQGPTLTEQVLP
ncbi:MAG: glycoside hydrolase family 43 protein [Janthinobacterium lividum]